jgi:hypothetical protein
MSTFEDRLWSQLVDEHGDKLRTRPGMTAPGHRRRRRPALITGTALAATSVTAAAVLGFSATTSTPPAYAVTTNADGTVTVTLDDISALTALNAELVRDRIRARAVPLTATCPRRGFPITMPAGTNPSTYTITIVQADIPAGFTAIVAASEDSSGQVKLAMGTSPSPGPSCVNSTPIAIYPVDPARR